ncbi:hypothetical protein [Halostella litorea]|uniref:hypothetical protein n=1 Tax=Halostella litorea TaxID=2528831 RepID=UPI001091E676|nr:hypothetical protein [Halostella litorea]
MFGRRSTHPVLQVLAAAAFLIGLVGFAVFGWRFSGDSGLVPTALGVGFAAVAVAWTLYSRFA